MKQIFLTVCLLCALVSNCFAQSTNTNTISKTETNFGVIGGLLHARADVQLNTGQATAKETGFYAGILLDVGISSKTHFQPEVLYTNIDGSGGLLIPLLVRVYLTEKLNIQFGPQIGFSLEDVPDDFTGTEFDATAGLGFDLFNNIIIEARYALQINNSYTGSQDIKAKATYFTLGLGYKF